MRKIQFIPSHRSLVILHDLGMAMLAWFLSWWIRFNLTFPFPEIEVFLYALPFVMVIQSVISWQFNLYRGIWRFASLPDLWNIFRAALLGSMIITLCLFIIFRLEGIPRSIPLLYPILLIILLGGPRLGYRLWKDHTLNLRTVSAAKRIFIIGAGRAGEMLAREMLRDGSCIPIGFIDDNKVLANSEIHGIRVLGPVSNIELYARKHDPDFIVIAVPSASNDQMRRIVQQAEKAQLPIRTLPKLNEMISGQPSVKELRDVSIEDLLGRDKIELDWQIIRKGIAGKVVMVTGGGGSIGTELCRQIVRLEPKQIIIFERSEFNLYRVLQELDVPDKKILVTGVLGDVSDKNKLEYTFSQYRPQVIFHAAAYKHVPILEGECREAVRNNVLGTINLANAAEKYLVEKFVLISTDKAVNPVNVLGATKRVAEMFCEYKNERGKTAFITVRFGNVLGSDGSVVPLFQKQIREGGPVTVTHPDISRFFMTIRESCQLILQASAMGTGGEIFVLDMGEPVKVHFLAEQMIRLSNPNPENRIEILITGLRPGEKLHEELFHGDEQKIKTSHAKILLARHPRIDMKQFMNQIAELESVCEMIDQDLIRNYLNSIVPFSGNQNKKTSNVISIVKA